MTEKDVPPTFEEWGTATRINDLLRQAEAHHDCHHCRAREVALGGWNAALATRSEEPLRGWPDWMRCDAQTILDVMGAGWPVAEWPHEQDAVEKLERILRLLAAEPSVPQNERFGSVSGENVQETELRKRGAYSFVILPAEEGGYCGYVRELPGCVTQGESVKETYDALQDAALTWIETVIEIGQAVPPPRGEVAFDADAPAEPQAYAPDPNRPVEKINPMSSWSDGVPPKKEKR